MKHAEFDKLLKEILERTTNVLSTKSNEYSTDVDKLHNFKRAGAMLNCTPEKALIGMWTKHIISILDIVDDIEVANSSYMQRLKEVFTLKFFKQYYERKINIKKVEEKIGDAINYLILLEALIKERYKE